MILFTEYSFILDQIEDGFIHRERRLGYEDDEQEDDNDTNITDDEENFVDVVSI